MKYAILALALLTLACSKKESPSEAPSSDSMGTTHEAEAEGTEAAPAEAQPEEAVLPSVEPPVVELIDAGRPPLRKVRWQFEKGSDERLKMKSAYVFQADVKGAKAGPRAGQRQVLPTMLQTIDFVIQDVSADGLAEVTFEVRDDAILNTPNVTPGLHITGAKGATGTYRVDSTGVIHDFAFTPPPDANPRADLEYVENLLRLMVFPVPDQPIGVRAKWTVTRDVERRGIPMKEQVTLELLKLAGSQITLAFELKSNGSRQTKVGKPSAEALRTEETSWDAKGRTKSSLTKLVPRLSTLENVLVLESKLTKPEGQTEQVDMIVERRIEMRRK